MRAAVQKIVLHSEGRSVGSTAGTTTEPSVGLTTKKSSGWMRSLCTPVGARKRWPSSVGPQIPPPVPDTHPFV